MSGDAKKAAPPVVITAQDAKEVTALIGHENCIRWEAMGGGHPSSLCTVTIGTAMINARKSQFPPDMKLDFSLPLAVCFECPPDQRPANTKVFQPTATGSAVDLAFAEPIAARVESVFDPPAVTATAKTGVVTPIIRGPTPAPAPGGPTQIDEKHTPQTNTNTTAAGSGGAGAVPSVSVSTSGDQKQSVSAPVPVAVAAPKKPEEPFLPADPSPVVKERAKQLTELLPMCSLRIATFVVSGLMKTPKNPNPSPLSVEAAYEQLSTAAGRAGAMEAFTKQLQEAKSNPAVTKTKSTPRPKERAAVEQLISIFPDVPIPAIKLALDKSDDSVEAAATLLSGSDKKIAKLISEAESLDFDRAKRASAEAARAAAAEPLTGEGGFMRGQTVDALYRVQDWLVGCTIKSVNSDGSYHLIYSNGNEIKNCPAQWIRAPSPPPEAIISALQKISANSPLARLILAVVKA